MKAWPDRNLAFNRCKCYINMIMIYVHLRENHEIAKGMTELPVPKTRKATLTEGLPSSMHISFVVTIVANLMAFGGVKDNVQRFGLTIRQWRIISLIAHMGPMTLSEIVNILHHEKSTLSRAAKDLEKRGLLCKLPNKRHKSSPLIWFTQEGQDLYDEIEPIFMEQANKFTSILNEDEKQQLCNILDKLKEHGEEVRAFEGWET